MSSEVQSEMDEFERGSELADALQLLPQPVLDAFTSWSLALDILDLLGIARRSNSVMIRLKRARTRQTRAALPRLPPHRTKPPTTPVHPRPISEKRRTR